MRIRRACKADLDRLLACRVDEPVSWANEADYRKNLAADSYRFEWTWIAEDSESILARAVWWGLPTSRHPLELDCLFAAPAVDDGVGICSQLIRRVLEVLPPEARRPTYQLLLQSDWRSCEKTRAAVDWRLEAAAIAGLTKTTERLRFEWTSSRPLPERSSRLKFVNEPDDEKWVDAFRRVATGSLDSATRRAVARYGEDVAARNLLATFLALPARRDWWRLAIDLQGELIGFAVPSRNESCHTVGYLGVFPNYRGRGYASDLLAETTHVLAEAGTERIIADADAENLPMVAAFGHLGYQRFAVRIVAS